MTDSRFQRLEDKLDKLTDAVSDLHGDMKVVKHTLAEHDASLGRLEESVKSTHLLLEKHDAKAVVALDKAREANDKATAAYNLADSQGEWLRVFPKLKSVALWVTACGGAAYFIWDRVIKHFVNQ